MQYTLARRIPTHSTIPAFRKYIPSIEIWKQNSVARRASQVAKIMLATQKISHQVAYITRQLAPQDAVHTRACAGIKKCP